MSKREYKKTVLLTGGAGFIGSNYLNRVVLECPEYFYINVDSLTYAGDLSNLKVADKENYTFCKTDIRDLGALQKVFEEYKPTHVMHFAAESHVDLSISDPNAFIETNVLGTHNLLRLAMQNGVLKFHQISTDEVYGALGKSDKPFTENSPLAPRNPYSASKASADLLARSYFETFNFPIVVTRSCNVYGPNQDASKVIPSFVTKLISNQKVPLYGKGEQVREWIYVEDCVDAIHRVFENGKGGEAYNIGTDYELNNLELTKRLLDITKRDESSIEYVEDRKGHDFRYSLDSSKVREELGWEPKVTFDEGLRSVVDFYRNKV